MLTEKVLDEVILVGDAIVVCGQVMSVTHHGFKPRGLAVQVLHWGDLTTENAVVAVLLQLSSEHQARAIERENVKVIHQNGNTHALAEDFHRLNVCEGAGSHPEGDDVERAGHSVAHHHIGKSICHAFFEGEIFSSSSPTCQQLKHPFSPMAYKEKEREINMLVTESTRL